MELWLNRRVPPVKDNAPPWVPALELTIVIPVPTTWALPIKIEPPLPDVLAFANVSERSRSRAPRRTSRIEEPY
eukprot:202262-Prymnesium_polylepis.1